MAEIISSNVQRWTPTDPRHASGRTNQQPRADLDNVRGSPQIPRLGVRHARGNKHRTGLECRIRVASWNIGTIKGRSLEVVETLERRKVDICCVQETRFRGKSARVFVGRRSRYKFIWCGNDQGTGGVGVLVAEKWIESILEVNRISDRIIHLRFVFGKNIVSVISVYAPQIGLSTAVKEAFYDDLLSLTTTISSTEALFICGDLNGHIGASASGFEGVHGGQAFGARNIEGDRILEFATACDLVVTNSFFKKRESHLITYTSGNGKTQIDYIITRRRDLKLVKDVKAIPNEECVSQHKLLVADTSLSVHPPKRRKFVPKCRIWKLKRPEYRQKFEDRVALELGNTNLQEQNSDSSWQCFKKALNTSAVAVCGMSKNHNWRKETWWWNNEVDAAIKEKRRAWNEWKKGGCRETYNRAKAIANKAVFQAKQVVEEEKFARVASNPSEIFKIARQMKQENLDVIGDKSIYDDEGKFCVGVKDKKRAWEQHYNRLCNEEFPWNEELLPPAPPVQGPPPEISRDMVEMAVKKLNSGKAPGPSDITAETIKAAGAVGVNHLHSLTNKIITEGAVPSDWLKSYILSLFKGKGSPTERGNYRGLKLIEHSLKVLERIMEVLIRDRVDIDAMQFGFRPGRGTTDAIFILRQLQEKYLAKHKVLYFAFVDLEKAFDRVPRKVIWWALRTVGVDEWIVRVIQSMYDGPISKIRVNDSYSDNISVKVGVHQGSVLSPLLFIIVLEALSKEFRTGCPWELFYADDLVVSAETPEALREKLLTWKHNFELKGLRVNMGKTKYMASGHNLDVLKDSGRFPCGVCRKGVGTNSILCSSCAHWVHHGCSGVKGKLKEDPSFKCSRCLGTARQIDARPCTEFEVGNDMLEAVDSFCYLGDMVSASGGCERAIITRIKCAWGKFRELMPLLTSRALSFRRRGHLFSTCVRRTLLHGAECWPTTIKDMDRLRRTDRAMIRWICNTRLKDRVPSVTLLSKLGLSSIESLVGGTRLRWFGHVARSSDWINRVTKLQVPGPQPRGRPKKTWQETVDKDRVEWRMQNTDPLDRDAWRAALQSRRKRGTIEPAG